MNILLQNPQWCFSVPNLAVLSRLRASLDLMFIADVGGATIGDATDQEDKEGLPPISVAARGGFLSISLQKRKETTPFN